MPHLKRCTYIRRLRVFRTLYAVSCSWYSVRVRYDVKSFSLHEAQPTAASADYRYCSEYTTAIVRLLLW